MESKEKRELCIHLLDYATDYSKIMHVFNKPLQQKYGRQRNLITPVFQLGDKLKLKHGNCGYAKRPSCVEYSVWGQLRSVI